MAYANGTFPAVLRRDDRAVPGVELQAHAVPLPRPNYLRDGRW